MATLLFWIYLINLTLLIVHEMDSVHWKEWNLFGLPGGVEGFLLVHIPLLLIALYGLIWTYQQTLAGLIVSLVISLAGMGGSGIHTYFIRTGHPEFKTPLSWMILAGMLLVSLAQAALTLYLMLRL